MATPSKGYYCKGKRVPGASTISGVGKECEGLNYWANRLGLEPYETLYALMLEQNPDYVAIQETLIKNPPWMYEHNRKKEAEGSVGTLGHELFDHWILTGNTKEMIDVDPDMLRRATQSYDNARRWWDGLAVVEVVATEFPMVSPQYEFGGTPDGLFKNRHGDFILPDWKTSGRIYREYVCQLAGYGHLVTNGNHAPNGVCGDTHFDIEEIAEYHIVRFSKDHGDFVHQSMTDVGVAWDLFKVKREMYRLDGQMKKRFG